VNTQVIVTPKGERLIVIPEAEYRILVEAAEDAADREAVRRFEAALATGEEELIPAEFVNRLIEGESPVRVWREFRGLSAEEVAERVGIELPALAALEGSEPLEASDTLERIAGVLRVDLEDLVIPDRA
jgi:hypothetical protein